MAKFQVRDLTGQQFDRFTVVSMEGRDKWRYALWRCRCVCGEERVVRSSALTAGGQRSCGCLAQEMISALGKASVKHGMAKTPEYLAYHGAKRRCNNETSKWFKYYGGRGIKFLFESFEDFIQHIGKMPEPKLTLDRIDNDGNYEKGNVRWATRQQQSRNTRSYLNRHRKMQSSSTHPRAVV